MQDGSKPSLKIIKIIKKISGTIEKEKKEFTPERVAKCCENMRKQLATGKREAIKKESLELYNRNQDAAPDSPEVIESKKLLEKKMSLENQKIVALSKALMERGELGSNVQKYIADFFES